MASNELSKLQAKFKDWELKAKTWVSNQPIHIEVALTTIASAAQGGFIGGLMGVMTNDIATGLPQQPGITTPETEAAMSSLKAMTASPWAQARNFAVMTGVNAGIAAAMKRARGGVEDWQSSMVSAFGSGIAFSLVSGIGGPNIGSAINTGLGFALVQGAIFQISKKFAQPNEDPLYLSTKTMLLQLGLEKYEKNFKKGLLTDNTLPLINDSALQEVKIPPGPRLLILDHIKRYKGNLRNSKK